MELIIPGILDMQPQYIDNINFPLAYSDKDVNIYLNPGYGDRVFNAYSVSYEHNDSDLYTAMRDSSLATLQNTLYYDDTTKLPSTPLQKGSFSATLISSKNQDVKYKINSGSNQFAILTQTYYPGWKAYLNGKEVSIYRADGNFDAVFIPKGKYVLEVNINRLNFISC